MNRCDQNALLHITLAIFSAGRGSFLALSAAGHAGACVYTTRYGASLSLGPGRAPWSVLFAFKVAGAGSFSRDCGDAEPPTTMETPQFQLFALLLLSQRPSSSQGIYLVAAAVQQQSPIKLPFVTGHRRR